MGIKHLSLGLLSAALLSGCGGSDATDSSSSSSNLSSSSRSSSSSSLSSSNSTNSSSTPSLSSSSSSVASEDVGIRPAKLLGFGAAATGGQGGRTVSVSTGTELNQAICGRASDDEPLIIRIEGKVTLGNTTAAGCDTLSDEILIKRKSNLSLIGVGTSGELEGLGIRLVDSANVIIQNLKIHDVLAGAGEGDGISLEGIGTQNVWIDHNELYTSVDVNDCGSSTIKDKYDGQIDVKKGAKLVTVSYNHIHDACKAMLTASSDSASAASDLITYHHNWFQRVYSRLPLARYTHAHLFNNYYDEVTDSGANSRMGAELLLENNYFSDVQNPVVSLYSSQVGFWNTRGNYYDMATGYTKQAVAGEALGEFGSDGEIIPTSSYQISEYSYSLDDALKVPALVMANAGVGKIEGAGEGSAGGSSSSSSAAGMSASSSSSTVASSSGSLPAGSSASNSSSSAGVSSSSSSSASSIAYSGPISQDCVELATNPGVNWRDTALKSDQEIVECLSQTLGRPVGYGEKALGGYDPNGSSVLTVIKKHAEKSVEEQVLEAISGDAHNWIVFDKVDFAERFEVGMYRLHCADAAVQSHLGATEAQCVNYQQWCQTKGYTGQAQCLDEFFNKALNASSLPIRNPVIGSNKTIDGRMSNAYFRFSGFAIGRDSSGVPTQTAQSVIVTHLDFQGAGHTEDHGLDPDMIRSTGASHDIWIHKNTFDLTGDSAFDVKVGAYDITMSFNQVIDVKRAALHGSSDSRTINEQITTTMHHNAFVTRDEHYITFGNTGRRVPLIRRGKSHMFNNVFVNYRKDVLSIRVGASVLWEDNMFVVNEALQEESTVDASLAGLSANLIRDIIGGSFRAEGSSLWFGDGDCNLNAATQTRVSPSSGTVGDLSLAYGAESRASINAQRVAAGQELVDYVSATAGKYGQLPFNSPMSSSRQHVLSLGKVSCQP